MSIQTSTKLIVITLVDGVNDDREESIKYLSWREYQIST